MRLILFGGKERYHSELRLAAICVKCRTGGDEHRDAKHPKSLEGRHDEGAMYAERSFQGDNMPGAGWLYNPVPSRVMRDRIF